MRTEVLVNTGPLQQTKTIRVNGTGTDVGAVTVGVVDAAGTVVTAAGTATTNAGSGVYTYDLPKPTVLGEYYASWTVTSDGQQLDDVIEVIGDYLFTEAQARAKRISGLQSPLASEADYTDAQIAEGRRVIVDTFESRLKRAVIPRYCRIEIGGRGGRRLHVANGYPISAGGKLLYRPGRARDIARVLSCTVDGDTVTPSDIVPVGGGVLHNKAGEWTPASHTDPHNIVLEYEYGPATADPEASENGIRLLLANLIPSDLGGAEVASASNPGGTTFKLTTYPKRVSEWLATSKGDLPVY